MLTSLHLQSRCGLGKAHYKAAAAWAKPTTIIVAVLVRFANKPPHSHFSITVATLQLNSMNVQRTHKQHYFRDLLMPLSPAPSTVPHCNFHSLTTLRSKTNWLARQHSCFNLLLPLSARQVACHDGFPCQRHLGGRFTIALCL